MMKKIIFAFLMTVGCFFLSSAMDSPIASAEAVWAYTDSRGIEYYVQTESARYEDPWNLGHYDQIWLFVDVRIIKPNRNHTETYAFTYYKGTGVWTGRELFSLHEYPLQDENHPELYPIWEIAREYA